MDPQTDSQAADGGRVLIDHAHEGHFGARLRAAREARGYTIEACGQALRLPVRLMRQLEAGEYGGIDYQVYLSGYLTKYGRHVGVDEEAIQAELARLAPRQRQPDLVVTGGVSHSRYLLERYVTAATYVVLTAIIVVPMVWLGVRGTLDRDMPRLAPLDATPVAQQDAPAPATSSAVSASTTNANAVASAPAPQAPETHVDEQQPVLASMAMFPPLDHSATRTPLATAAAAPEADANTAGQAQGQGAHSLTLSLPSASWVEVTSADGSRLEYGILPAGTQKSYRSDGALDVRIGNATGAQVSIDGEAVPLDGFRRANVARFHVDVRDGKASPVAN